MRACTRSMAAPARRSASISASPLIIRNSRRTGVADAGRPLTDWASGIRCRAGIASATATREPACRVDFTS